MTLLCLDDRPRRPWRSIVAAFRDPARSDFAFVPHHYICAPLELLDDHVSPNESTPINASRKEIGAQPSKLHRNRFFFLHVLAIGMSGFCCSWLTLFPISPNRLYNMQVDAFNTNHDHAVFFFRPCLYLGNILGAAAAGYLGDRFGRAGGLELAAIPYIIGWLLVGLAYGETTILLGRYMLGAAAGIMSVIAPIYLAEISSASIRGRLLCVQAFMAGLGRLTYLGLGALFITLSRSYFGFNLSEWKVLAMTGLVPGFALLLSTQCLPDSPTWLVFRHGDHEAAFGILAKLMGGNYRYAEQEVNALIHAHTMTRQRDNPHRGAFFRPLLLCCMLFTLRASAALFIEPILSDTASNTFVASLFGVGLDMGEVDLLYVLMVMWIAASLGTLCAFLVIDTRGRLAALRAGCWLAAVCSSLLLVVLCREKYTSIHLSDSASAALLLIVAGHYLGLGLGPMVMLSELFPARQRIGAASVVIIWEGVVNYALSQVLPFVRETMDSTQLLILATSVVLAANSMALMLCWAHLPEATRRSLQEIEAILSGWLPATPQLGFGRRGSRPWVQQQPMTTYGT